VGSVTALPLEVALTSLADDRIQGGLYAAAGIPVYWIVNLVDKQIEVHWGPSATGYSSREIFLAGDAVPVVIDGATVGRIAVEDLLP
jgi:Uma2 family endonuclease